MRTLLTNEERLRRMREHWKKQAAERRQPGSEFKVCPEGGRAHQSRSGVRERGERLISPHAMEVAERYFWRKRGFDSPPITSGGVMA